MSFFRRILMMNLYIIPLVLLITCSLSIANANPYYAHDEPNEQYNDFIYTLYDNPLLFMALILGLITTIIFSTLWIIQAWQEHKNKLKEQNQNVS